MGCDPDGSGGGLVPGRVTGCYLALLVDEMAAGLGPARCAVLVVAPAALLDERVGQPDGVFAYDLLTGHPKRADHDVVFLLDLLEEANRRPELAWAGAWVDWDRMGEAIVDRYRRGEIKGLWFAELPGVAELTGAKVDLLARAPAADVREQARARLRREITERFARWLHQPSGRRPDETFL